MMQGCGGGGGESDRGGNACSALNAKIFNGEVCNKSSRTPVVALYPIAESGGQLFDAGICTATLVTVDDFLTSAHCFVTPVLENPNLVGFLAVVGGEAIPVVGLAIHPSYNGQAGNRYDIAMGTLQRLPNPAIGPVPLLVSQLTLVNQEASAFGYGTSNLGEIGTLKSAEFLIDGFSAGNILATQQSANASICQGDSGGPLMQIVNGVTSLVGVNSYVTVSSQQCAASGSPISGFVDIQSASILDFIAAYAPDVAVN
jgi:secreted trypsin-like serine protease